MFMDGRILSPYAPHTLALIVGLLVAQHHWMRAPGERRESLVWLRYVACWGVLYGISYAVVFEAHALAAYKAGLECGLVLFVTLVVDIARAYARPATLPSAIVYAERIERRAA